MAKKRGEVEHKKQESTPASLDEAESGAQEKDRVPEPDMPKIEAVRRVLDEDPDMKPARGVAIIKERFGITISPSHFSASKSQIRSRDRDGGSEEDSARGWRLQDLKRYEPTLGHLRTVKDGLKELAGSEAFRLVQEDPESIEEWLKIVTAVGSLAERVGGMGQLQKCMEALLEFAPKK